MSQTELEILHSRGDPYIITHIHLPWAHIVHLRLRLLITFRERRSHDVWENPRACGRSDACPRSMVAEGDKVTTDKSPPKNIFGFPQSHDDRYSKALRPRCRAEDRRRAIRLEPCTPSPAPAPRPVRRSLISTLIHFGKLIKSHVCQKPPGSSGVFPIDVMLG